MTRKVSLCPAQLIKEAKIKAKGIGAEQALHG